MNSRTSFLISGPLSGCGSACQLGARPPVVPVGIPAASKGWRATPSVSRLYTRARGCDDEVALAARSSNSSRSASAGSCASLTTAAEARIAAGVVEGKDWRRANPAVGREQVRGLDLRSFRAATCPRGISTGATGGPFSTGLDSESGRKTCLSGLRIYSSRVIRANPHDYGRCRPFGRMVTRAPSGAFSPSPCGTTKFGGKALTGPGHAL
jgi:hypothetical protein